MKPIRKIAVIGATGMLGIPVAIALMEAGFEVTALARNVEQARRVFGATPRRRSASDSISFARNESDSKKSARARP